jgi:uncharacterized membrane protein required for colicin V production
MTAYDGVMIGLVLAGMVWGSIRGFSWGIASIGALLVGYAFAHVASEYMLPFLAQNMPGDPAVQRGGAMLLAFVVSSGGCLFAAWSARASLKKMKFELYDRHLGVLFGGVEAALLGVIGTMFVACLVPKAREPIFSSRAGHVVARVMDAAGPALPPEVRQAITPSWGGLPTTASRRSFIPNDSVNAEVERLGENGDVRNLKRQ